MKNYAKYISYGADFNQQLYDRRVREDEIKNLFPKNIEYSLQQNFRNSYYILNYRIRNIEAILDSIDSSNTDLYNLKINLEI